MLDLHRPGGDDRRRGEPRGRLRGHCAHSSGDHAAGGGASGHGARAGQSGSAHGRAATCGSTARRGPAGGSSAAGRAELGEDELLDQHETADRIHGRQGPARVAQLPPEDLAALAGAKVAPHGRRGAGDALGHLAELEPHLLAGEQTRLGRLGQRHSRAYEKRLDARHRGVHRLEDLLVGESVDLAQEQRRALRLGQLPDVRHDLPELLARVDGVRRGGAPVALERVHRVLPGVLRPAEVVEAAVARDAIEPGACVDRTLVRADRVEGGGEHLLQHVLGVLRGAEHVAAEGEQPRVVAVHERLEGAMVPASDQRDELLVTLKPQQRRPRGQRGSLS